MRKLFAAGGAVLLSAALLSPPASGQIPAAVSLRFEIAEAHPLAEIPARADTAFLSSESAAVFGADTLAVVAKFQASSVPDDVDFAIAWVRCGGRAPEQLAVKRVDAGDLVSGAYAMLTNSGEPFAPGAYQVAVVGAGGRIFCAVPFSVRAPSGVAAARPRAQSDVDAAYAAYAFDGLALSYPASYSADAVAVGPARGVILSRSAPFASMFVIVRRAGRYDLDRDAGDLLAFLARRVATDGYGAWHRGAVDFDARELEPVDIAGRTAVGRAFLARLGSGLALDVTVYATELRGKSAVVGYVTLADAGAAADETRPDPAADDFYRLLLTLEPGGKGTPAEPRREPARRARPGLDVAVMRRVGGPWYS